LKRVMDWQLSHAAEQNGNVGADGYQPHSR
jgi:hypothetical protein